MNFVSFGSLSKCRVVCASKELVLICPGCLSVRLCSRDSHVVPKKKELNTNCEFMIYASYASPLCWFSFFFSTNGGPFKTDLIWPTTVELSTHVDEPI